MACPFPGMDPYLEGPAWWPDFHATFINYWREVIADVLPSGYWARLGERYFLVTEPLVIPGEVRETYIAIVRGRDQSLVAVLELLSPANKENPGRGDYLAKRHKLLRQHVHLVELDLLRAGQRLPLQEPLPPADYYYLLARAEGRPACQVYSWTVRQQLPVLPVPLRAPDLDVVIDLGAAFATAYQRGRYRNQIDYAEPPPGPFQRDDAAWVAQQVTRL